MAHFLSAPFAPLAVVFSQALLLPVHGAVYCPQPLKGFTSYTPKYAQRKLLISLGFIDVAGAGGEEVLAPSR